MALEQHSKIYYGPRITETNKFIDLVFDGTTYVIELSSGSYTITDLANHVASKINETTGGSFTVTVNRDLRRITFFNLLDFDLLFSSGVNATRSAANLLGFNYNDYLGDNTYTSVNAVGLSYSTQFYFQSYKSTTQNRKAIDGVINKSASGLVEVIKFGNERFMEGELLFITNIIQNNESIIRTNTTGVEDYISLIEWMTEKYPFEVMINEANSEEFQKFTLESTEQDSKGLDYELIELYDRSLPLYYRSGKLKFRLME
jgi:hypothetical protein